MNLADEIAAELPPDPPSERRAARPKRVASTPWGKAYEHANSLDVGAVLDRLGVERDGTRLTCPGCGATSGCDVVDGGIKCLHDHCADRGKSGFRTNIDLVAEVRRVKPREALRLLGEWFAFDLPESKAAGDEPVTAHFDIIEADAIFAPLDPLQYVIDGIVPQGTIVEIESYGGSGKSWLGIDALVAVAMGRPWLGRFRTERGRVAAVDYENGLREDRRRIQAVALARGAELVEGIAVASMPPLYMTDASFEPAMRELAEGRSLVVIDTLRAASPGVDENDSRMRQGLDLLRRVAESTSCAFVVLVHSKKLSGNAGETDLREAGRGSSAIYDAADVVLHCTYKDGTLDVRCAKSRLGRDFEPFVATIVDEAGGAVRVVASDVPDPSDEADRALDELTDKVLDIIRANPGCSSRLIREKARGKAQRVDVAVEILERHGVIRNLGSTKHGKPSAWYPVAPSGRTEGTC